MFDYDEDEKESVLESTTVETKERSKYDNLTKLFDFLLRADSGDADHELNPVLCGYFSKLLGNLITRRPKELFTFFTERPDVVHRMTKHLYSTAISESLTRVMLCDGHGL